MSTKPVISPTGAPKWGSFALVTYLPDPLGSFLTELRHLLTGDRMPDAHITFLPPRQLTAPVEVASTEVRQIFDLVPPFEVELGGVHVFSETNMLYLRVKAGNAVLLNLHRSLNMGRLFADEHFEFVPHLTLSGPLDPSIIEPTCEKARTVWGSSNLSRRFVVSEVVLLYQSSASSGQDWTHHSSYPLATGIIRT